MWFWDTTPPHDTTPKIFYSDHTVLFTGWTCQNKTKDLGSSSSKYRQHLCNIKLVCTHCKLDLSTHWLRQYYCNPDIPFSHPPVSSPLPPSRRLATSSLAAAQDGNVNSRRTQGVHLPSTSLANLQCLTPRPKPKIKLKLKIHATTTNTYTT